ncbi:hypothetical protein LCGC14_2011270 [marine sediment metagenome]|uniref:Uncharacterized protein n=1 Tax=marine sediment metagenome TaxID=412755 RepID=A0A0F9F0A2_9ZZZZ
MAVSMTAQNGSIAMKSFPQTRRAVLVGGGATVIAGTSGLLVPAQAKALAPTPSMRGGANNYRPGAPLVDLPISASRSGPIQPKGMSATPRAMARP